MERNVCFYRIGSGASHGSAWPGGRRVVLLSPGKSSEQSGWQALRLGPRAVPLGRHGRRALAQNLSRLDRHVPLAASGDQALSVLSALSGGWIDFTR